jgi:uracil-DNA glycosylase
MLINLPDDWADLLAPELSKPSFHALSAFVDAERREENVFPPTGDVFNAFRYSSYAATRVVILGQDPYHGAGQAHGLAFSVRPGIVIPPSLGNIFKELASDIGCPPPSSGTLTGWAEQGVLLLNTVLTVRQANANSHKGKGWEKFTDGVIAKLSAKDTPVVFVLWGGPARKKRALIDAKRHTIIESAHPSPLSAHNGFFGSRPFSSANQALVASGQTPIDWCRTASLQEELDARDDGEREGQVFEHDLFNLG